MSAEVSTTRLNPQFDTAAVREHYRLDNRVRIYPFLLPEDALSMLRCLGKETEFASAFNIDGANAAMSDAEMGRLTADQVRGLQQKINDSAARGEGFLYGRNNLTGPDRNPGPTLLQDFVDLLNSETLLQAVRDISGHADIQAASAQATRYLPGNFLTRHNDFHPDDGRRVAYVMSFAHEWHPDWGGLLQFYETDGTPRDAWTPIFNAMTLFDVAHVHAVTYVAPFARTPRLSITGWFRTRPL